MKWSHPAWPSFALQGQDFQGSRHHLLIGSLPSSSPWSTSLINIYPHDTMADDQLNGNLGFELFLLLRSLGSRRGATDWFKPFTWEQIGINININTSWLLGSVELNKIYNNIYLCSLNSRSLWRWRRSTWHSLTDHPEKGPKVIRKSSWKGTKNHPKEGPVILREKIKDSTSAISFTG